jgi:transcriptional regulator
MGDSPPEYIAQMLKAVVGIQVEIQRIEGKAKLSQNREVRDRLNAADTLLAKGAEGLGEAMRNAIKES